MRDPTALGQLIAQVLLSQEEDPECRELTLEWAVDYLVGAEVSQAVKEFDSSYGTLRAMPERFEGAGDTEAWTIPWESKKGVCRAIVVEDQNLNLVFVRRDIPSLPELDRLRSALHGFDPSKELRIYRYWKMPTDEERAEWTAERLMLDPSWVTQHFSDCPDGAYGYGPNRPTLDWLIEHDGTKYNDCRDAAFVARTPEMGHPEGRTLGNYRTIRHAMFEIHSLSVSLEVESDA